MKPTVIDLSHYQPHVDLAKAKADGVLGVIHKATEGSAGWTDGLYRIRKAECAKLGLAFAPYHFLKPGNIAQQAAHFLQFAAPPKGGRVFIDYEDKGLKLGDLKEMILSLEALDDTLEIGIYGGALLKQQVGLAALTWLGAYPLWLAQYTTGEPTWPGNTWRFWSLWQYTDAAEVAGVGKCDGNVFNGSDENLKKFLDPVPGGRPIKIPDPDPDTQTETKEPHVEVSIVTEPGVEVSVWINGNQMVPA
jgi:lysozyme